MSIIELAPVAMSRPPSQASLRGVLASSLLGVAMLVGCGVDDRPAEWEFVSAAIFQPTCATASCHSPAAAASGLDFSTPTRGYLSLRGLWSWIPVAPDAGAPPAGTPCATLNGTLVCETPVRPLVTPYDPAGSRVVNMLRGRGAPRMPPDRPLTEADIRLVERWILNGACERGPSCGTPAPAPTDARTDQRVDGGT